MVLLTRFGIDIHHRSFQYMFAGIFKLYFPPQGSKGSTVGRFTKSLRRQSLVDIYTRCIFIVERKAGQTTGSIELVKHRVCCITQLHFIPTFDDRRRLSCTQPAYPKFNTSKLFI